MVLQEIKSIEESFYQRRAQFCVTNFLQSFPESKKTQSLLLPGENTAPISLNLHKNPPSIQVRKFPVGGANKGIIRIRSKLSENLSQPIVVAEEKDLTRECVIITLGDTTLDLILGNGLFPSLQIAEVLQNLKQGHPDYFLVLQRYIMGIEKDDGLKVPFDIVTPQDDATFVYLETLPKSLK